MATRAFWNIADIRSSSWPRQSTYLEVAYLLLHGELPTETQLKSWTWNITHHTVINENIKKVMDGFHYNAHPMGMFVSHAGQRSRPFIPTRKDIFNQDSA